MCCRRQFVQVLRFAPAAVKPVALALYDAEHPGREGRCRAQRTDLSIELPKRHLYRVFCVFSGRTGSPGKPSQVGLTGRQQVQQRRRVARGGRLNQLRIGASYRV